VGNAGRHCTRSLACEIKKAHEHSHYRSSRNRPAFPHAMVLTVSFVLSPASPALLPPSPAVCLRQLDTSVRVSGPHDFAVRVSAVRLWHYRVHCIPRPTFVTIAKRPFCVGGDGTSINQNFDLVKLISEIPKSVSSCRWRAQQRQTPLHSITSSARASSVGGIFRPSALAALTLMTSSKVAGCSTGRSEALVPPRTFPA
jgi:hypothetical protein